jgi:hypothetical protein
VVRITEADIIGDSTSPALVRLYQIAIEAFHHAGHFFAPGRRGVTGELARLLGQHGLQDVQMRAYTLEYRAGTDQCQHFYEDVRLALRTGVPFLHKWSRVPDDYEAIYQQMLSDM